MTQTEVTTAAMNLALQDNDAKDISPSDLRNAMASALGGYASLILSVGPATMFAVTATPIAISIWDTLVAQSIDVNAAGSTASLATELITVGEAGIYFVNFFASFTTGNNNKTVQFQPFVNAGATPIKVLQRLGTASDVQNATFMGTFILAKDDEIDMRVAVVAGAPDDVIFQSSSFSIFRVG